VPVLRVATLLVPVLLVLGAAASPPASAAGPDGVWPLRPRPAVVADFAPGPERWSAGHRGVDLRGSGGATVRSALPGRVLYAGRLAGRGVVSVDHGGFRTTYEPVTATVSRGDQVGRGAAIGTLERLGSHCFPGACLHWGLIVGEDYRDPLTLVGAGPVRLLPLGGLPGWWAAAAAPYATPHATARVGERPRGWQAPARGAAALFRGAG
jgi:murein DD-endopeptidase MepM/ murein hydrolase activator NlpD